MPRLSEKTMRARMKMLERLKEHDRKVIESLMKEIKHKDEKIMWFKRKLRLM
jgi:hypothetical protein